jgi:hypothetical protein
VGKLVFENADLFEKLILNVLGHPASMAASRVAQSANPERT